MNQGAWYSSHTICEEDFSALSRFAFSHAGRKASAAAAAGHMGLHTEQQKALIEQALTGVEIAPYDGV